MLPLRHLSRGVSSLYHEIKPAGLDVIGSNVTDGQATIAKYVRETGLTYKLTTSGLPGWLWMRDYGPYLPADLYGVYCFPTNFIVGSNGRIANRFCEFDEAEIREAHARMDLPPIEQDYSSRTGAPKSQWHDNYIPVICDRESDLKYKSCMPALQAHECLRHACLSADSNGFTKDTTMHYVIVLQKSLLRAFLCLSLIAITAIPGLADWTCDDIELDQEITSYNDGGVGDIQINSGNTVEAYANADSVSELPTGGSDIEFHYTFKRRYIYSGEGGGHWVSYDFWLSAAASAQGDWNTDTGIGYGYAAAGPGETDLISQSIVGVDFKSDSDSLTDEQVHPLTATAFVNVEVRVIALANSAGTGRGSGSASATLVFANNL